MKFSEAIQKEINGVKKPTAYLGISSACWVCHEAISRNSGCQYNSCSVCPFRYEIIKAVSDIRQHTCSSFRTAFDKGAKWAVDAALSIQKTLELDGD